MSILLKHAHSAGDKQDHDAERYEDLDHGEHFGPAREQWRVSRAEGGALGECDEQVIDKPRPPARACELGALIVRDLHLWEKKTSAAEFFLFVPHRRTAAVQSPIPKREYDHVGQPEQRARAQKF